MTVLIIIGAVIALVVILLYFPLTAEISYVNNELRVMVKYLIFTVFSIPPQKKKSEGKGKRQKEKSPKKIPEKDKADKSSDEDNSKSESDVEDLTLTPEDEELLNPKSSGETEQKDKVSGIMDKIRDYKRIILLVWELVNKNIKNICKCVRVDDVDIDITAAGEDAFEASMLYGKLHAALWNIISFSGQLIPISVKNAEIKISYNTDKPVYSLKGKIRITPAVVVGNVIAAAFKLLLHINEIRPNNGKDVNDGNKG